MGPVVETPMKLKILFLFVIAAIIATIAKVYGASPSYSNFATNHFTTNNVQAGQVLIGIQPDVLFPAAFLPNLFFEVYQNEHFGVGKNAGGQVGKYGWTQANSGGDGVTLNTHANHWGTVELRSGTNANTLQSIFNTVNTSRPTIARVNATAGWTNRIIWRLINTNAAQAYIAFHGGAGFAIGGGGGEQNIGLFINTTNGPQIQGYCNTSSTLLFTATNLGAIVSGQWYTNSWLSYTPGVICFTLNDGPLACISNTIPTTPMSLGAGINKVIDAAGTNSILEIDEWFLFMTRSAVSSCDTVNDSSLQAYWALEEASGTRDDAKGANNLTDNNTVTSSTGIIGQAGEFEQLGTEWLSIADNAALSTGDIDYTIAGWVDIEALPGTGLARYVLGKNSVVAGNFEYSLILQDTANVDRFMWSVSGDGLTYTTVTANTFGTPVINTWYFFLVEHNATANTITISINNGVADSTAHSTGSFDGTGGFGIGSIFETTPGVSGWDGAIDEVFFTKRLLTTAEKAAIYNAGSACRPDGL